jgi:hypothetical protein
MKQVLRLRIITPLKNEWKRWKYWVRRQLSCIWSIESWEPKPKTTIFRLHVEDFGGNRKWNIFRLRLREAIRARRRRKHEKALLDAMAGAPRDGMDLLMSAKVMGKMKKALDKQAAEKDFDAEQALSTRAGEQFMERNLGVLFRIGDRKLPQLLKIEPSAVADMSGMLPLYEVAKLNGMNMQAETEFLFKRAFRACINDLIKRNHVHKKQLELIEHRAHQKAGAMTEAENLKILRKWTASNRSGRMYALRKQQMNKKELELIPAKKR